MLEWAPGAEAQAVALPPEWRELPLNAALGWAVNPAGVPIWGGAAAARDPQQFGRIEHGWEVYQIE